MTGLSSSEWCADAPIWGQIPFFSTADGVPLESTLKNTLISTVGDVLVGLSTALATFPNQHPEDCYLEFKQRYISSTGVAPTPELVLPRHDIITLMVSLQDRLPSQYRQAAEQTIWQRRVSGEWYYIDPSIEMRVLDEDHSATLIASIHVTQREDLPFFRYRCPSCSGMQALCTRRRNRTRASTMVMLQSYGWKQTRRAALPLRGLTVKIATEMYMEAIEKHNRDTSEQRRLQQLQQHTGSEQIIQQRHLLKATRRCKYLDFVELATGSNVCKSSAQEADTAAGKMKKKIGN
ncbi:hypothetical protein NADE_002684 [Nannochloris sp. 'desiccata']|nr:hypothetical protein NADE_002684 [Chlorella desiccata (nom. nud.)]